MNDLPIPAVQAGGTTPCGLTDLAVIDTEEPTVVPAALAHLRDAARYACGAAFRNGHCPPEVPVAVLADTVAALCELARQAGPYVGDFWPHAAERVRHARTLLEQARGLLDAARHETVLTPPNEDHQPVATTASPSVPANAG